MAWIQTNNGPIWEADTPSTTPSNNSQYFSTVGQPFNPPQQVATVSNPVTFTPQQLAEQEYKSLWGTRGDGSDLNNVQATSAATGKPMLQVMKENPQFTYLLDAMPNWTSLNPDYVSGGAGQIHDGLSWIQKTLSDAAPYAAAAGGAFLGPFAGLLIGSGLSAFNKGWSGVKSGLFSNATAAYGADSLNQQGFFGKSMAANRGFTIPTTTNLSNPGNARNSQTDKWRMDTKGGFGLNKAQDDDEDKKGGIMDWFGKIKKNPLGTALGALSLYQGMNQDTPEFSYNPPAREDMISPELLAQQQNISDMLAGINWNDKGGYSEEELAALRESFKVNLSDYTKDSVDAIKANLEARGMESSRQGDLMYENLDKNTKSQAEQFERDLLLQNAQLQRSDYAQKMNQYNSGFGDLMQLQQLAQAKEQAQYARAFDQYQIDYAKATQQTQGYQNFASQMLAKIFFDDEKPNFMDIFKMGRES